MLSHSEQKVNLLLKNIDDVAVVAEQTSASTEESAAAEKTRIIRSLLLPHPKNSLSYAERIEKRISIKTMKEDTLFFII